MFQLQRQLAGWVGQRHSQGPGEYTRWALGLVRVEIWLPGGEPAGPEANLCTAVTTVPTSETHNRTGLSWQLAWTYNVQGRPLEISTGCMRLTGISPSAPPSPGSGTSPPHLQACGLGPHAVGRWLWYKFRALCFLCPLITSHFSPSCLRLEQLP